MADRGTIAIGLPVDQISGRVLAQIRYVTSRSQSRSQGIILLRKLFRTRQFIHNITLDSILTSISFYTFVFFTVAIVSFASFYSVVVVTALPLPRFSLLSLIILPFSNLACCHCYLSLCSPLSLVPLPNSCLLSLIGLPLPRFRLLPLLPLPL